MAGITMWRDALLVAGKDLRIEARSRVATMQILPFAVLVIVLFAFGLDSDRRVLRQATPGLFWVAVLFATVLAVQRSFALEVADRGIDGLRVSGLDGAGVFLGKAAAVAAQLIVLEVLLGVGVVVLYDTRLRTSGVLLLAVTAIAVTVGLAAAGTLYGGLAAGTRVRETLLPVLFLPVAAPVLLGAARAGEAALGVTPGLAVGEGWPWARLLMVFAVIYTAIGILSFGSILEDT